MKKFCCCVLTLVFAVASFAGCAARNTAPGESEPTMPSSSQEESQPAVSAVEPETPSIAEESDKSEPSPNPETVSFALGLAGGEVLSMHVGDAIGGWTLADLEITYFGEDSLYAGDVSVLTATFAGDVTLQGSLTRSNFVEDAFDFWVTDEDGSKMPRYVSPEMADDEGSFVFMVDIPENLALAQEPDFGEELSCQITVSEYRFVFGHMMAPAGVTITDIQIL
jgi:hypothetical protein